MVEINDNGKEGLQFLTQEYLDNMNIPQVVPLFEDKDAFSSNKSLYDWDKIQYMEETLGIYIPDEWKEGDRRFVLGTFAVLQAIIAWKSLDEDDVKEKESYLEVLNERIVNQCLSREGDQFFRHSQNDSSEKLSTRKLNKDELLQIIYYLEIYQGD